VDENDIRLLEKAIITIISDKQLRNELSFKAVHLAKQNHSIDIIKKRFIEILGGNNE
jgi:glycosyltransferase involved in cell wall biosynthesis